jgi:DNA polymerase III alpha subunit
MAKNGKHFGAFTLSDYTGNSEFRLFGDEYHKMKKWLTKDYFIVVSGEHSASRYDANKFYTNIKSIAYLPDIHETNLVNHVKIVLTNSDLSDKADEHIEVESTLPIADVALDIDVDAPLENEELSSAPLVFKTKGTDLISHLTSLFKDYPGETPVFVNFIDVDDNLNISLLKSEGVEYKAEFRQKLKDLGVDFKEKLNGNW